MEARISTVPKSKGSVTIAYSDGKDHGQKQFFDADANGEFVYRWTIPPDAPTGRAAVLVAASDGSGAGNVGFWPFDVAEPGGC